MYSATSKVIQYYKTIKNYREEVEIYFPGFKAFIDSTEQEIPVPTDKKEKKRVLFWQKEKTYCKNTVYGKQEKGEILHKSKFKEGRQHDYTVYKDVHPITPKSVENYYDLGYIGVEKDFPNVKVVLPIKKKRNVIELTQKEKIYNKRDIVDRE